MKKSRRACLGAVASGGAGIALAAADPAAAASPSPAATKTPPPPSPQAAALAAGMRRFDPGLSDADVRTIAQAIDANDAAARVLNPKKKRLANGVAPVGRFIVPDGAA